jgi:hypothetical protein
MSSIGLVAIQSVRFPNAFLRMDGSNVTQGAGGGGGTVNCQYYPSGSYPVPSIGNKEVFDLIPLPGEDAGYAIRSLNYANVFLRMDGSHVTQSEGGGSGTVNCQSYPTGSYPQNNSSDYEHFLIGPVFGESTYYYIFSGLFQQAFLRIDGSNVTQSQADGSGTVNCQYYPPGASASSPDDYEVFNIIYLTPPAAVST